MTEKKGCGCGGGQSQEPCGSGEKSAGGCGSGQSEGGCGCSGLALELYWCETCRRTVAEKRCPLCGQKARRTRPDDGR